MITSCEDLFHLVGESEGRVKVEFLILKGSFNKVYFHVVCYERKHSVYFSALEFLISFLCPV